MAKTANHVGRRYAVIIGPGHIGSMNYREIGLSSGRRFTYAV